MTSFLPECGHRTWEEGGREETLRPTSFLLPPRLDFPCARAPDPLSALIHRAPGDGPVHRSSPGAGRGVFPRSPDRNGWPRAGQDGDRGRDTYAFADATGADRRVGAVADRDPSTRLAADSSVSKARAGQGAHRQADHPVLRGRVRKRTDGFGAPGGSLARGANPAAGRARNG